MKSFFKAINGSIDDMEKFEEKQMINKIPFVKSSWYNWLINYFFECIAKWVFLRQSYSTNVSAMCMEMEINQEN